MIYPNDFEIRLGFDRIRTMIENNTTTNAAKELLRNIGFLSSYDIIKESLDTSQEMLVITMMESGFPKGGYIDINNFLSKIKAEGTYLDTEEIVSINKALIAVKELVDFFTSKEADTYPNLYNRSTQVVLLPFITERINNIIDRFGKIKDNASNELSIIRHSLSEKEQQVGRRLQSILRSARSEGIVDEDTTISIRDGRAVIPVPSSNKRKLKGFIHDESATGKTSYIEPIEIVELNNAIKELEYEERREIIKILIDFSAFIRPYIPNLIHIGEFIAFIDLLVAKTKVAMSMNAVRPILSLQREIRLRNARHPLLEKALKKDGKKIVPLNISLDKNKHILMISGANAGGKSICLKSVGLLQYMIQCGLLIPVDENSEIGIFDDIFIDIGDQQSLDNDLSTYSSHLQNMKNMLKYSSDRSLILIDEFGTGTEPVMGGAIAETILEKFEQKGVFGVITTHYSNLKYYASNAKGIINGAMTFDVQHIQPLFGLEIGKPGSSFALEIARKIGLPEDVVISAQEKIGTEQVSMEKQLREIARDKRYWENKRDSIRLAEKRAKELSDKYESELSTILDKRKELISSAKQQAQDIMSQANKQIENAIREIKEAQAEKEKTKQIRKEIDTFKDTILGNASTTEEDAAISRKIQKIKDRQQKREKQNNITTEKSVVIPSKDHDIAPGDKVRIKGQLIIGEVNKIAGNKCFVSFGQLITQVDKNKLEFISNSEYKKQQKDMSSTSTLYGTTIKSNSGYNVTEKRLNFKTEIDLRGARVDEAISKVQEFIDEAYMLNITNLRILHGKGTGALKEEIRRYLRTVPFVSDCRDEHVQFGGAGITVITLEEL